MNNCTSRGRFFKYRPRRFKLVIDCSVGFCMSLASSFVEYDKSGRSCDKYAALITTLRLCLGSVFLTVFDLTRIHFTRVNALHLVS